MLISAILTMVGLLFGTIFVQQGFSQGQQLIFQEARQWQIASDAPAENTFLPNGDGTTNTFSTSSQAYFYQEVDEGVETHDGDTSYVQGPNEADDSMFLELENVPDNFATASACEIKAAHEEDGTGDDTITLYYQIFESDETTAITAESSGVTVVQGS